MWLRPLIAFVAIVTFGLGVPYVTATPSMYDSEVTAPKGKVEVTMFCQPCLKSSSGQIWCPVGPKE
jgi:hypothetical protein